MVGRNERSMVSGDLGLDLSLIDPKIWVRGLGMTIV